MEVFSVIEHRVDDLPPGEGQRSTTEKSFGLIVTIQLIIAIGLTGLLTWDLIDLDAARNTLPIFGRLGVISALAFSFYLQKTIFSSNGKIAGSSLIFNLFLYSISLLSGITFWLLQMQYSSQLSTSIATYASVEPIILITCTIIGVYCLRRSMGLYEESQNQPEIIKSPHSMFSTFLILFTILESTFGILFCISMNLLISDDYEYTKRCVCLVGIYISSIINELAISFSREKRNSLLTKTVGFFINLVCTQATWWISYYNERQLTLYGLGVGFLTLVFGVLYTVEMSLQTAQLNAHNPDLQGIRPSGPFSQSIRKESGDSKRGNNEGGDEMMRRKKILNEKTVVGVITVMEISLCLLPVVVLITNEPNWIQGWSMWTLGFMGSLIMNEIILFQRKINYLLVSCSNLAFCINFGAGCILSYKGIKMSMDEHGITVNKWIVVAFWIPFFLLTHIDFVRLVKFSLKLEELEEMKKRKRDLNVSLCFASGIESMVAVAAFIPTTDFGTFPGGIFSLLTFPSLSVVAEVILRFGRYYKGPFIMTFIAFFLGLCYSQLVWYMSVVFECESGNILKLGRKLSYAIGFGMGVLGFMGVVRFLYVIVRQWERKEAE